MSASWSSYLHSVLLSPSSSKLHVSKIRVFVDCQSLACGSQWNYTAFTCSPPVEPEFLLLRALSFSVPEVKSAGFGSLASTSHSFRNSTSFTFKHSSHSLSPRGSQGGDPAHPQGRHVSLIPQQSHSDGLSMHTWPNMGQKDPIPGFSPFPLGLLSC